MTSSDGFNNSALINQTVEKNNIFVSMKWNYNKCFSRVKMAKRFLIKRVFLELRTDEKLLWQGVVRRGVIPVTTSYSHNLGR